MRKKNECKSLRRCPNLHIKQSKQTNHFFPSPHICQFSPLNWSIRFEGITWSMKSSNMDSQHFLPTLWSCNISMRDQLKSHLTKTQMWKKFRSLAMKQWGNVWPLSLLFEGYYFFGMNKCRLSAILLSRAWQNSKLSFVLGGKLSPQSLRKLTVR